MTLRRIACTAIALGAAISVQGAPLEATITTARVNSQLFKLKLAAAAHPVPEPVPWFAFTTGVAYIAYRRKQIKLGL